MTPPSWKSFVERLCAEAWSFDEHATASLLTSLEALSQAQDFTDHEVADTLCAAGVTEWAAQLTAPRIREGMLADRA